MNRRERSPPVAASLLRSACWSRRARQPATTTTTPVPTPSAVALGQRGTGHRTRAPEHRRRDGELPEVLRPRRRPARAGPRCRPARYMDKIQERGRLIAGVSADTLLLGARNPISGKIEGFDIDMLHAVSQAIFGDPNKIELRVITAAQRLPVLQKGSVDIVARNMTINCARWKEIAFSSEYYRSGQKVLVRRGEKTATAARSPAWRTEGQEGLRPQRLDQHGQAAHLQGTSSRWAPTPHTGCLVLFQQGSVDAITGDDTVLAGPGRPGPVRRGRPGAGVHRRAVRPRRQQGQRRLRAVRQRRPRGDAAPTASGPGATTPGWPTPWARRRLRPSRSTDGRQ